MKAELIATKQFDSAVSDLLTADELAELEFYLASDSQAHPVIPDTGGVRKARWARSGMGTRGGIRVIYFHVPRAHVVLLMAAYAKNVQENLNNDQKKKIRALARQFEESLAGRSDRPRI